jgi:dihydropteroate synthase
MSVIWDGSRYLSPTVKVFVEVAFDFTRTQFERLGRLELPKYQNEFGFPVTVQPSRKPTVAV